MGMWASKIVCEVKNLSSLPCIPLVFILTFAVVSDLSSSIIFDQIIFLPTDYEVGTKFGCKDTVPV